MAKPITKNQFADLWLEEFMSKDGVCLLCDQFGSIATKDGSKFCICPNGRARKKRGY